MKKFMDKNALSPVIGIILMILVVIVITAIFTFYLFGVGDTETKGSKYGILVKNNPETTGILDMKIVHAGGDPIKAGDWKLSIVRAGEAPVFQVGITDFNVGDQIITTNLTDSPGNYTISNHSVLAPGGNNSFQAGVEYSVMITVFPFKTIPIDSIIELR